MKEKEYNKDSGQFTDQNSSKINNSSKTSSQEIDSNSSGFYKFFCQ